MKARERRKGLRDKKFEKSSFLKNNQILHAYNNYVQLFCRLLYIKVETRGTLKKNSKNNIHVEQNDLNGKTMLFYPSILSSIGMK